MDGNHIEEGLYGENPDPRRGGLERYLAGVEYGKTRGLSPEDKARLTERWKQEELSRINTAESFLDKIKGYQAKGISLRDIPLEEKVRLLKDHREFTGIENPHYPEGVSSEQVHLTLRSKYLEARSLFKEA